MANVAVDVPQELLDQLAQSRFGKVRVAERVRVALAIQLFLAEEISIGRAAELAGYPLIDFHDLLRELGLPTAFYGPEEYAQDRATMEAMERERGGERGR